MLVEQAVYYAFITLVWFWYSVWWSVNTWHFNKNYCKPIHRILTFFLMFKTLNCAFTYLSMITCENDETCHWNLATTSSFTIYNTFLFTNLLLLSKGFSFVKEYLDRNELTVVAMSMAAIYVGFSAYSINKTKLIILPLLLLCLFFSLNIYYTRLTLQSLIFEYRQLSSQNNPILLPYLITKLTLYKILFRTLCFYMPIKIFGLFFSWLFSPPMTTSNSISPGLKIIDESSEIFCLLIITWVFRAKNRGDYFELGHFSEEREMRRFIPINKAQVPTSLTVEKLENNPILLITPKGKNQCVYTNFLIANPVRT